jgi:hypothetical protein
MSEQSTVTFADLVLMLATMTAVHFGEIEDPATGERHTNLPVAGQMIDLLTVLQEKTKGNLTPEEGQLLDTVLYELRLRFINANKEAPRIITP